MHTNHYIAGYEAMEQRGKLTAAQINDLIQSRRMSLSLGRGFGETVESFLARNPLIAEFEEWASKRKRAYE